MSYCDLRYSDGRVYGIMGMEFAGNTKPNYWYVKGDIVFSRYKCMKHKLNNILPLYLEKLTEFENMAVNGYTKVYDLGNKKFIWNRGEI